MYKWDWRDIASMKHNKEWKKIVRKIGDFFH